jgi:hypothetical protein
VELVQQHVERALVAGTPAIPDAALALPEIALDLRGAERLPAADPHGEAREAREGRGHAGGRLRGRHDQHLLAVRLHRRVVRVHARDRGNAGRGGGAARHRGREAVAARAEGGARHEHVGPHRLERPADLRPRRRLLLGDVVVAADHGRDDAAGITERRLERAARPHRLGADRHAHVGLLLAADPGEELVQVVDDA